jgi:hypothetical protein
MGKPWSLSLEFTPFNANKTQEKWVNMKRFLLLLLTMVFSGGLLAQITWGTPQQISTVGVNASNVSLVEDTNNNVTAAWLENGSVVSQSLPSGGSWSASTTLTTVSASSLHVKIDGSGNVIAMWIENNTVYTASLPFGGSWSTKAAISGTGASQVRLSVASNGDAVAVWTRNNYIESAVQPSGGSWSLVSMLSSLGAEDSPDIASNASGTAVAIWHTVVSGADVIHSSTATALGSWNSEVDVLAIVPGLHHNHPKVAVDGNGNAVAVWFKYALSDGVYSNVQAVSASLGMSQTSWTAIPTVFDTQLGLINPANLQSEIRFDGSGNAIALWTNSYDGAIYNILTAVLPLGQSWQLFASLVLNNENGYAGDVWVDSFGHTLAAYMWFDGTNVAVQAAETDLTSPNYNFYTAPVTVSTGSDNGYSKVAFSTQGTTQNSVALWNGFDGTHTTILAATGTRTIVSPPTSLSVVQNSINDGIFTEYANTVSWTLSGSPNITEYAIYRDGFHISNVGSSTTSFVDHNAVPSGSVVYGIVAIDNNNEQSQFVTVSYP